MKLTMLGAKTFPLKSGGIETHIYELATRLNKKHNVTVITGSEAKNPSEETIKGVKVKRAPFLELNILNSLPIAQARFSIKGTMMPSIIWKARLTKTDIYHAHDAVMGFFSLFNFLRPTVYTAHGVGYKRKDWPFYVKHFLKIFEMTAFKFADKVIAVDGKTAKEVRKYRKQVEVIHNGVTTSIFKKQKNPFKNNKLKILFVGRMIPTKGPDILINAFKALPEKTRKKAELWLIGKGPELNTLKKMTKHDKDIHLPGFVPSTEPYFAHSDIFVLSSLYEGFPFTLLEGMASNNACIATDIADLKQVFKHGKELLIIPPGNEKTLKKALEALINNSAGRKKIAETGKKRIEKDFNWEKLIKKIENVYKTIPKKSTTLHKILFLPFFILSALPVALILILVTILRLPFALLDLLTSKK